MARYTCRDAKPPAVHVDPEGADVHASFDQYGALDSVREGARLHVAPALVEAAVEALAGYGTTVLRVDPAELREPQIPQTPRRQGYGGQVAQTAEPDPAEGPTRGRKRG